MIAETYTSPLRMEAESVKEKCGKQKKNKPGVCGG